MIYRKYADFRSGIFNPLGVSEYYYDSVGKYNLVVGNNELTYNTYPILTSNNYTSYTVTKTGGGASGTWGISISGNAGTATAATKLQTARTINGTAFDGTANITTSKWGTARTLSLTGAVTGSVSIDGSGNVSIVTTYAAANISALDSRYVNVSGDTMTGTLTLKELRSAPGSNLAFARVTGGSYYIIGSTGVFAGGLSVRNSADSSAISTIAGVYASGSNVVYNYYGGNSYTNPGMVITGSKNVGIGTTSPSYKLHVVGVAYVSTGIFSDGYVSAKGQNTSSDMRLKDVLSDVRLKTKDIAKAPSMRFAWKDGGGIDVGSSAQYWKHILPDAVKERNGYYEMAYGNIALACSIALAKNVVNIEDRVTILENENNRLKKEIVELKKRARL